MTKNYLSILLFSICFYPLFIEQEASAQNWSPVDVGINGGVWALCTYNGELYAGGQFTTAGSVSANNIAKWNGSSWSAVGTGVNGPVYAFVVYNGVLYVGGGFTQAGGDSAWFIAKWNGSNWSRVGMLGMTNTVTRNVNSLCVYNGSLYAGGSFGEVDFMPASAIARWNGANWDSVGSGMHLSSNGGNVLSLTTYNSDLFAGGVFNIAGTSQVSNIAKWNGSTWSSPGIGVSLVDDVTSLAVYNSNLYACGWFNLAGGIPANNIARWNGLNWDSLGSGTSTSSGSNSAIVTYNNSLIVGGEFTHAGSIQANYIASWNGINWDSLGSGMNQIIAALAIYDSVLYAGGAFNIAGGIFANHIARWNGTVGINEPFKKDHAIIIYPNPTNSVLKIETNIHYSGLKLWNTLGQLVMEKGNSTFVSITNIEQGIYYLQFFDDAGNLLTTKKVVKQ